MSHPPKPQPRCNRDSVAFRIAGGDGQSCLEMLELGMVALSFASTTKTDADLICAVEAQICARQTIEDTLWAVAAQLAEHDSENAYLGFDATMVFLREQMARVDANEVVS